MTLNIVDFPAPLGPTMEKLGFLDVEADVVQRLEAAKIDRKVFTCKWLI